MLSLLSGTVPLPRLGTLLWMPLWHQVIKKMSRAGLCACSWLLLCGVHRLLRLGQKLQPGQRQQHMPWWPGSGAGASL